MRIIAPDAPVRSSLAVYARKAGPIALVEKEVGGAQGVLVTASPKVFEQALGMAGAKARSR